MQIPGMLKTLTKLDLAVLAVFVMYLVFPMKTPDMLANVVDTTLGMVTVFAVAVYLFYYANPVIAVVFLFVAYELMRRSSKQTGKAAIDVHTPTQAKKDVTMKAMNPPKKETLEEEIVDKMAPVGHSDMSVYNATTYKPVAEDVGTASMY